jgi:sialidase-1
MNRQTGITLIVSLLWFSLTRAADIERVDVFKAGDGQYHTYRIPSVTVTKKGTVLAFCEGRKKNRSDAGDIDLVLRRSSDDGKTWGQLQVVWDDDGNTCGNPCPIVDRETGTIWLLLTHNLGEDKEAQIVDGKSKGSRTVWVSKSSDDGESWSKPVDITFETKQKDWTWYATGPGVGIQLKSGRLLIPCDNKVAGTKARQSHVITSDDHGKTWKLGGVVEPNCNESQAVELSDGSVLLNMRSYEANKLRLIATSKDGGVTFTKPVEDKTLIEPVCQASILRYPGDKNAILFSNPASGKREKMTIRLSGDDCKTWSASKLLHEGPAAYSCLTVLPDKTIGCLYECGTKDPYERIEFARFPLDWVK